MGARRQRSHFTRILAPERAQAEGTTAGALSTVVEITISGCRECCAPRVKPTIWLFDRLESWQHYYVIFFANLVRVPLYFISLGSATGHCTLHSFHAPDVLLR